MYCVSSSFVRKSIQEKRKKIPHIIDLNFLGHGRRRRRRSRRCQDPLSNGSYENDLTIKEALNLLKRMEDEKVGDMSRNLMPVRQALENTLLTIGKLAEEMENEKVKVEDEKFKPSVES